MIDDLFNKDIVIYKQINLFDATATEYGEIVENWVAVEENKGYLPDGAYNFTFNKHGISVVNNGDMFILYSAYLENLDRILMDGNFYTVSDKNVIHEPSTGDHHHIEFNVSQIDRMGNIVALPISLLPSAVQSSTTIIKATLNKDITYPFLLSALTPGMYIKSIDVSIQSVFNVDNIVFLYNSDELLNDELLDEIRFHQSYIDYKCDVAGNITVNIPGTIAQGEADIYIEVINA